MAKKAYSVGLCKELTRRAADSALLVPSRASRYEAGDVLDLSFTTVWPEVEGRGRFRVESFVGGGFAGQVYRCVVVSVDLPAKPAGFAVKAGDICAVKILVPPTRGKQWFRNALYWIGFLSPFSAQVNRAACRAGLLWQKLARLAMKVETGADDAVADVYASFYDSTMCAYGEIREWVEGRTWRLECDLRPRARRQWRTVALSDTDSPEYVAKRRFMAYFVKLLHRMGAAELARQYEWSTMKSQPNVLKRAGHDGDPAGGLCAVDFRAGLALLPFLPMSPGDLRLIVAGLFRGSLVQFDRADFRKLREYVADRGRSCPEMIPLSQALQEYDAAYRRSMPDVTHQGLRLMVDPRLRLDVRAGLAEGYRAGGLVDDAFADRIPRQPLRFLLFQLLAVIPGLGSLLRRLWGDGVYRRHVRRMLTEGAYWRRVFSARMAATLVEWHRAGRTGEERTRFLAGHADSFWVQRFTLGLLPAAWHRVLAEPAYVKARLVEWIRFARSFYRDAAYREAWFREQVNRGREDGMLDDQERDAILARIRDPFIVKYLKCLAVHFATLPVSEITWAIVGIVMVAWEVLHGATWGHALRDFGAVGAVALLTLPISPGSLVRGGYVVYLMIKERNLRDYIIAAPISVVKIMGYLAFPIQMVTSYPALSRFMASEWATGAVHGVPVFGEKGALLEHRVFDLFFNAPRVFGRWARRRMRGLLDVWLLLGLIILLAAFVWRHVPWSGKTGINLTIAVTAVFILPRVLFYPMLRRKNRETDAQ